jgi:hypothetical protein
MVAELAIEKNYSCVICGHIHQPSKRIITTEKGSVTYLNSGDWVEHFTALEYRDNDWHIYTYDATDMQTTKIQSQKPQPEVITNQIAIYLHSLIPQTPAI